MVIYQLSLKVYIKYIIAPPFTDDELPTFTEGREKDIKHRRSLSMAYQLSLKVEGEYISPSFTGNELPTFTEDRKKKIS